LPVVDTVVVVEYGMTAVEHEVVDAVRVVVFVGVLWGPVLLVADLMLKGFFVLLARETKTPGWIWTQQLMQTVIDPSMDLECWCSRSSLC
jgi:hypothetical protein